MSDVYRRLLDEELALEEAAGLLRIQTSSSVEPGSLNLDTLPEDRREKASQLFDAAIRPILDPYLAGEVASDVTARRLAPLVRPMGVFALNVNLPPGPG